MEKEKVDVLIVVDMQNDFVTGPLGTPEAQAIVPKVVEKIKSWKGEILYTQDTHYDNYLETQEGKHLPVKHCIEHTRGWLFVDEIEHDLLPEMKDPQAKIYEKRTFGSTLLMEDLCDSHFSTIGGMADFKINSITLVGLCTDICVISNALLLKAALPEVPIIVDASCCAGVTPESHKNALAAMIRNSVRLSIVHIRIRQLWLKLTKLGNMASASFMLSSRLSRRRMLPKISVPRAVV